MCERERGICNRNLNPGWKIKAASYLAPYSEKSISFLSANVSSAESSRALLSDWVLILRWNGMQENADKPLKWPDVLLAILNSSLCHSNTFPTSAYISQYARECMRVCVRVSVFNAVLVTSLGLRIPSSCIGFHLESQRNLKLRSSK